MIVSTNTSRCLIKHLCSTVLCLSLASTGLAQEKDSRAACIAYQANLDSLTTFKCRYRFTKATAVNMERAILGDYENIRSCDFIYVLDEDKSRFQALSKIDTEPPPSILRDIKNAKRGQIVGYSKDFSPVAEIKFGQEGFSYFEPWNRATLSNKDETPRQDIQNPLSLVGHQATLGPARLLGLQGEWKVALSSNGVAGIRDNPAIHVNIAGSEWGKADWYFGPNQGYLPLTIRYNTLSPDKKPYPEEETHLLKATKLGKQGWFPMHVVHITKSKKEGGAVTVIDLQVTELTDQVTDDDLKIDLPAGTKIEWRLPEKNGTDSFKTQKLESIGPDEISKIKKMLIAKASNPLMDTAVNPTNPSNFKWYLVGAVGLALLAVAYVRYRRNKLEPSR